MGRCGGGVPGGSSLTTPSPVQPSERSRSIAGIVSWPIGCTSDHHPRGGLNESSDVDAKKGFQLAPEARAVDSRLQQAMCEWRCASLSTMKQWAEGKIARHTHTLIKDTHTLTTYTHTHAHAHPTASTTTPAEIRLLYGSAWVLTEAHGLIERLRTDWLRLMKPGHVMSSITLPSPAHAAPCSSLRLHECWQTVAYYEPRCGRQLQ